LFEFDLRLRIIVAVIAAYRAALDSACSATRLLVLHALTLALMLIRILAQTNSPPRTK
jgi:hypothetical protein